jgi:hypothetical protein
MDFAKTHCLIDHIVYIAGSSDIKVGVTRQNQIPTRWIDQGASYAIKLARTPNRYLAGLIEVSLKDIFRDKTNWRYMLMNRIPENISLVNEKSKAKSSLPEALKQYVVDDDEIFNFIYPVEIYPSRVKSVSLDTSSDFTGEFAGIKGQYLIFKDGNVLNIRKHAGYLVRLQV